MEMRKKISLAIAVVTVLSGVLVLGTAIARDQNQGRLDRAGVLIVQTGWTSDANTISMKQLKADYCDGHISHTKAAAEIASTLLECKPDLDFSDPNSFYPGSKNRKILVDLAEVIPRMKVLTVDSISFFRDASHYPLKTESLASMPITHLIMTGTTAISRYTGKSADQYGPGVLTEKIRPYFEKADYVHVSNEVSFTEPCLFQPGLRFCSKQKHFDAFKDIRVNVVELTGNHNRDFGEGPFLTTLKWFQTNGMHTFGGGRDETVANTPIFLDMKGGGSIGIIGFNELCPLGECAAGKTPGANRFEISKARKAIQDMRRGRTPLFVLVTVQFGEISAYQPTQSQRAISLDLLNSGADMVFGSQAHQVQQMEFHNGKVILHGLGNFFFDQTHTLGLRQAYFMNLYFSAGKLLAMEPIFTWIDDKFRPAIASEDQATQIRRAIYSDYLLYK